MDKAKNFYREEVNAFEKLADVDEMKYKKLQNSVEETNRKISDLKAQLLDDLKYKREELIELAKSKKAEEETLRIQEKTKS